MPEPTTVIFSWAPGALLDALQFLDFSQEAPGKTAGGEKDKQNAKER